MGGGSDFIIKKQCIENELKQFFLVTRGLPNRNFSFHDDLTSDSKKLGQSAVVKHYSIWLYIEWK